MRSILFVKLTNRKVGTQKSLTFLLHHPDRLRFQVARSCLFGFTSHFFSCLAFRRLHSILFQMKFFPLFLLLCSLFVQNSMVWCTCWSHVLKEGLTHRIPQNVLPAESWREDFPDALRANLQIWNVLNVAMDILPRLSSIMSPIKLKELSTTGPWKHAKTAFTIFDRRGNFLQLSMFPYHSSIHCSSFRGGMAVCPRNALTSSS